MFDNDESEIGDIDKNREERDEENIDSPTKHLYYHAVAMT